MTENQDQRDPLFNTPLFLRAAATAAFFFAGSYFLTLISVVFSPRDDADFFGTARSQTGDAIAYGVFSTAAKLSLICSILLFLYGILRAFRVRPDTPAALESQAKIKASSQVVEARNMKELPPASTEEEVFSSRHREASRHRNRQEAAQPQFDERGRSHSDRIFEDD